MAHDLLSHAQVSKQVISLLAGVSSHGDQHLAEVERDLVQMDVLLEEAIRKLGSSFLAIHQAVNRQQEALGVLLAADNPPSDYAARLEAIRREIDGHVGAAVTGLQFQDMTSQLIGRMVHHLTGLRGVFGELDASAPQPPESPEESLLERLSRISDRVDARCAPQLARARAVNQHHMESGDIELF